MKPVGPGLGDVVDLGSSIPSLIHGIRKGVDGDVRDGIQPQDKVGGKAAIQVGQGIVGFQPIDDVSVRQRRQTVELDVAVPIRPAHEIVATPGRVNERARGELQGVG